MKSNQRRMIDMKVYITHSKGVTDKQTYSRSYQTPLIIILPIPFISHLLSLYSVVPVHY